MEDSRKQERLKQPPKHRALRRPWRRPLPKRRRNVPHVPTGARGANPFNLVAMALLAISHLLSPISHVRAATVTADLEDVVPGMPINTKVTIVPQSNPQTQGSKLQVGVTRSITPVSGQISTNLVAGSYKVFIRPYEFDINVPDNTNTYTLGALATNVTTYTYTNAMIVIGAATDFWTDEDGLTPWTEE